MIFELFNFKKPCKSFHTHQLLTKLKKKKVVQLQAAKEKRLNKNYKTPTRDFGASSTSLEALTSNEKQKSDSKIDFYAQLKLPGCK